VYCSDASHMLSTAKFQGLSKHSEHLGDKDVVLKSPQKPGMQHLHWSLDFSILCSGKAVFESGQPAMLGMSSADIRCIGLPKARLKLVCSAKGQDVFPRVLPNMIAVCKAMAS
jgi:hypothetical protein